MKFSSSFASLSFALLVSTLAMGASLAANAAPSGADAEQIQTPTQTQIQTQAASKALGLGGWIQRYQARVTATQNQQPHWITPLVTITPRLEQEFRTDFVHGYTPQGDALWNYDNGKGLELIPFRRIELLFNAPPFQNHLAPKTNDGFGDLSFLGKFRIYARNEQSGNAIVTAFLGGSIPTGKNGNGSCCAIVTPTLAMGKGWGLFDLTTTAAGTLPVTNSNGLGHTVIWNSVAQYQLAHSGWRRLFWPELETNANFFLGGANDGKTTTYMTPGVLIGRVPLTHPANGKPGRLGLTFGAGEQIAVTRFHALNHNLILTARIPF